MTGAVLGDCASRTVLPPFGLSREAASQAKPAATIAGALVTPYGNACRKRDAIQAVRDRFYAQYLKLTADMQAEIARIEREFG